MTTDYIRREDAVKASLEFAVEYLGGAFDEELQKGLKNDLESLKPADVVSKNDIAVLLNETVKELTSRRKKSIVDSFIVSVIGTVKCKIMQMGEKKDG